jgi:hypothetical protein
MQSYNNAKINLINKHFDKQILIHNTIPKKCKSLQYTVYNKIIKRARCSDLKDHIQVQNTLIKYV